MKSKNEACAPSNQGQKGEQEQKSKWKDENEDVKFVCNGATVKCPYCSIPWGKLVVTRRSVVLQGKLWATAADNNGNTNFNFVGLCTHPRWGNNKPPCKNVITLGFWKNLSDVSVGGFKALLVKSTIPCRVSGEEITIVHSGQTARLDMRKAIMVRSIRVVEQLEPGFDYDGTESNKVRGMVCGKTYHLEATSFDNGTPEDREIQWEAEYLFTDGRKGVVMNGDLSDKWSPKGRSVKFSPLESSRAGGTLVFYAYVSYAKDEARMEVWSHFRFRFFPFQEVETQISQRMREPWRIDQNATSLCGMACLFYVFAKRHPVEYREFIINMHHKGEATFNGYTVRPDKAVQDAMYNMDPASDNYPSMDGTKPNEKALMPFADWLTLAVLRSHVSSTWEIPLILPVGGPQLLFIMHKMVYNGEKESTMDKLAAVNWPSMMEDLCRDFLGFKSVESFGLSTNSLERRKSIMRFRRYDEDNTDDLQSLLQMQQAYEKGATVLMMIDSQMFKNIVSHSLSDLFNFSHWIVYEGGLKFLDEKGEMVEDFSDVSRLVFQFATWGCNPTASSSLLKKSEISIECFKSTFYGYMICKNE